MTFQNVSHPKSVYLQMTAYCIEQLHQCKTTSNYKKIWTLQQWARTWGIRFNATKCYKMSIHRSKDPYTHHYSLDNHILEQVENNPYLGVLISRDLKWSTHINKICNKANSTLEFIRRNLKHCNKKFKETAYISLVRSVMDYSATVCRILTFKKT